MSAIFCKSREETLVGKGCQVQVRAQQGLPGPPQVCQGCFRPGKRGVPTCVLPPLHIRTILSRLPTKRVHGGVKMCTACAHMLARLPFRGFFTAHLSCHCSGEQSAQVTGWCTLIQVGWVGDETVVGGNQPCEGGLPST